MVFLNSRVHWIHPLRSSECRPVFHDAVRSEIISVLSWPIRSHTSHSRPGSPDIFTNSTAAGRVPDGRTPGGVGFFPMAPKPRGRFGFDCEPTSTDVRTGLANFSIRGRKWSWTSKPASCASVPTFLLHILLSYGMTGIR